MMHEFVSEIETGLGFIFKEDVEKYYKWYSGGEELSSEEKQELLNMLTAANLLK